MKVARAVFYIEAVGNFVAACILFFSPNTFVSQFVVNQTVPALPLELFRWYGVLLFTFVYVMLRALSQRDETALSIVVEGFLLADILQLVGCIVFVSAGGMWSLPLIGFTGATAVLAAVRIGWLWGHYRAQGVGK